MRAPDFVIGDPKDPYLLRWFVIPRNRVFNIYLHKFCKSDDDRALHDHPWLFNASILLKGSYIEHRLNKKAKVRKRFRLYFRWGKAPHRVELFTFDHEESECLNFMGPCKYHLEGATKGPQPVWTIFITGPIVREWGFYCPSGWKPWRKFVEIREGGNHVGKGCD